MEDLSRLTKHSEVKIFETISRYLIMLCLLFGAIRDTSIWQTSNTIDFQKKLLINRIQDFDSENPILSYRQIYTFTQDFEEIINILRQFQAYNLDEAVDQKINDLISNYRSVQDGFEEAIRRYYISPMDFALSDDEIEVFNKNILDMQLLAFKLQEISNSSNDLVLSKVFNDSGFILLMITVAAGVVFLMKKLQEK